MSRLNPAFPRALDVNADPVNGGKLYVYEAGTTTPVSLYSDKELTATLSNPVVAGAAGRFQDVYLPDGLYKVVVKDASDVTLDEADNVVVGRGDDSDLAFDTYAIAEASRTGTATHIRIAGLRYIQDDNGTAFADADGRAFSPLIDATPEHWNVTGTALEAEDGGYLTTPAADETTGLKAMIAWAMANGRNIVGRKDRSYGFSEALEIGTTASVTAIGRPHVALNLVVVGGSWTAGDQTDADPRNWTWGDAAVTVGNSTGSGAKPAIDTDIRVDANRLAPVGIHFKGNGYAKCTYYAERATEADVREGERGNDSTSCTDTEFYGGGRHYAYQERSDGSFGADDGTGWYGLTGRTSRGLVVETSDGEHFVEHSAGLNDLVLVGGFNSHFNGGKFWNGETRTDAAARTIWIAQGVGNYKFSGTEIDDGAARIESFEGGFINCQFTQYTAAKQLQIVANDADETLDQFVFVGNRMGTDDASLITQGSGTWGAIRPKVSNNITGTGGAYAIGAFTDTLGENARITNDGALELDLDSANVPNLRIQTDLEGNPSLVPRWSDALDFSNKFYFDAVRRKWVFDSDDLAYMWDVEAYDPAVTFTDVDVGSGLYRHVPSIAVKSDTHLVGGYLYNASSSGESQPGQRATFFRSFDGGTTIGTANEELNSATYSTNPLTPGAEGDIQGEVFVAYDNILDQEIATVANRGSSLGQNRGFIAFRDATADPTTDKWTAYCFRVNSTTNELDLSSTDVNGTSFDSGYKGTYTIDGTEYDFVPFKPVFAVNGDLMVPIQFVNNYGTDQRIGFAVRSNGVWSMQGVVPLGVIGLGDAWEPTTWQASDGTWYCQVRNNGALGGDSYDNHARAVSTDLQSWTPFAYLDEDVHVNRRMHSRTGDGKWISVGTSHEGNRNALSVGFSLDGQFFTHGTTIGDETDGTDFVHYSDVSCYDSTAYVLFSEEPNQAVAPAPNTIRLAVFDLPTGVPIMGSDKNYYENGSGTRPSVSGDELTIPPQMSGGIPAGDGSYALTIKAKVSVTPNSVPYRIASVGDEATGYFSVEYRNNGGTCELWVNDHYIEDIADPDAYRSFLIAFDMTRGIVACENQYAQLSQRARVYLGDVLNAGSAQAGNIVYSANGCSVARYPYGLPSILVPGAANFDGRFPSRAKAVSSIAAGELDWMQDGEAFEAEGYYYKREAGATDIPDMPDFVPAGVVSPHHFADNTTPFTTDMTTAVQAAYDFVASETGRRMAIDGQFLVTSTLDFDTEGVIVEGSGQYSTDKAVILVDHTSGAGIHVSASRQVLSDFRVKGSTTRGGTTQDYRNPGVLIDPPDTPAAQLNSVHLKNLLVDDHNGSGIVANQVTEIILDHCKVTDCRRHAFVAGNSDEVDRTNKDVYTGQITMNAGSYTADGHTVVVGAESGTAMGASVYRFHARSVDSAGGPVSSSGLTIGAAGWWVRAQNVLIENSAMNAGDTAGEGLIVSGSNVVVGRANRFLGLDSSAYAVRVVNWNSSNTTEDVLIDRNMIVGTLPSTAAVRLDTTSDATYAPVTADEVSVIWTHPDVPATVVANPETLRRVETASASYIGSDLTVKSQGTNGGVSIDGDATDTVNLRFKIGGTTKFSWHWNDTSGLATWDFNSTNVMYSEGTIVTFPVGVATPADGFTAVASGVLNATECYVRATGEGGVNDDVDTLQFDGDATPADGTVIKVTAGSSSQTITFKHATGNIRCGSDRALDNAADYAEFMYNATGGYWVMTSFQDNGT